MDPDSSLRICFYSVTTPRGECTAWCKSKTKRPTSKKPDYRQGEVSLNRMQIVQPALHNARPSYRWNKAETSLAFHLRDNSFEWCFYINMLLEWAITDKIKGLFHRHWLPQPLGACIITVAILGNSGFPLWRSSNCISRARDKFKRIKMKL